MSSSTWTREELLSNHASMDGNCWRAVEAQHRISTLKLVGTLVEQDLLEKIVEEAKPPIPVGLRGFHYLLSTPFRYAAPYPRGSRFRGAGMTEGVFYGCQSPETAIAEMVFYRFLFFAESPGTPLPRNPAEYTIFQVRLRSSAILDLTREPLNRDREIWRRPDDYEACQALAETARACGTEILRYESVRDPEHRANYAVLSYMAFAQKQPLSEQTWHILLKQDGALATCEAPKMGADFRLSDFTSDKRLSDFASQRARSV
jgi:hypothetical protein